MPLDARVLAATNRFLAAAVAEGDFREDLYYRLNVVSIVVPPLRKRADDIPLLVAHFLQSFGQPDCQVDPEVRDVLERHPWPGNVRQLENVIERALVLQKEPGRLTVADLPPEVRSPQVRPATAVGEFPQGGVDLKKVEKDLIQAALAKTGGNQTQAARMLGISRYALIYRMQKHDLR